MADDAPILTLADAFDITMAPFAARVPPWSGPRPSEADDYGTLFAFPGAIMSSWSLYHDRARKHFATTLFQRPALPKEIEMDGRRWCVVRAEEV